MLQRFSRGLCTLWQKLLSADFLPDEADGNFVLIDRLLFSAPVSPVCSRCGDSSHMGITSITRGRGALSSACERRQIQRRVEC